MADFELEEENDSLNNLNISETAEGDSPTSTNNDIINPDQKDLRSSLSSAYEAAQNKTIEKDFDQKGERANATTKTYQPTLKTPRSWSKEASDWLVTQPKTLEEAIELRKKIAEYAAKRQNEQDADYTSKTQEIVRMRDAFQKEAQSFRELFQTFQPRMKDFYLRGVSPHQWLNEVFELENLAKENPKAALLHLSKQWGVNPQELLQLQQQSAIPPALEGALKQQQQEIARMKAVLQQQEQMKVQAVTSANTQAVNQFRTATDDSGNLLYPHVDAVTNEMIPFIKMLQANNPNASQKEILTEAYDRAVWANKQLREEMLTQKQRQEAAKRVVEAKRAATPVNSNPNGSVASGNFSLRDAIADAWEQHARV